MVLLIVSLIANVFFLGAIGGGIWHWAHNPGMGLRGGWRRAGKQLPQPQADAFRQMIRTTMQGNRDALRQGRVARADAARLFVQPTFDANAVIADLDKARAADMALRSQLEHNVVKFSAHLPQDQRQKMADALKQGPFREGPPRPPRGDHPD
jgi:uncharacterized membrane protein